MSGDLGPDSCSLFMGPGANIGFCTDTLSLFDFVFVFYIKQM